QLYAIKLSNYEVYLAASRTYQPFWNDILKYGEKHFYKSVSYKTTFADNMKFARKYLADKFPERLFVGLQTRHDNIINGNGDILDMKNFKEIVLANCKLPNHFVHFYHGGAHMCRYEVDFFHQLTKLDLAHVIQEMIHYKFYEPFFDCPVCVNGIIQSKLTLEVALTDLYLLRYTNSQDVKKAVGTDGLDLSRTIVQKMFESKKQKSS
ncbi:MAG: hypothetical protein ACLRFO_03710, partial [Alphaproteobacteria bacterium]